MIRRHVSGLLALGFFLLVAAISMLGTRASRLAFSEATSRNLNSWDLLISATSDVYLLVFFAVPFLLVRGFRSARGEAEPMVLIRHGSRAAWLLNQIVRSALEVGVVLVAWFLLAAVLATGHGWELEWSGASVLRDPANVPMHVWSHSGQGPMLTLLTQAGLLLATGTGVMVALAAALVWGLPSRVVMLACSVAFVATVLSFKLEWPLSELVRPVNFLAGYHALGATGTLAWFILVPAVVTVLLVVATNLWEKRRTTSAIQGAISPSRAIYAGALVLGVVAQNSSNASLLAAVPDATVSTFYGVTEGGFSLLSYLFSSIFLLGIAYLAHESLTARLNGRIYYELLRAGGALPWVVRLVPRFLAFVGMTLVGAAVLNAAVFLAMRQLRGSGGQTVAPPSAVWHQYFVNGALQVFVMAAILLITTWVTQRVASGVIALGGMALLAVPAFNPGGWLPLGLGSAGIAALGDGAVWHATIVLAAWLAPLLVAAVLVVRRTDVAFE